MAQGEQPEKRTLRGSVSTCFVLFDHDSEPKWGAQQTYLEDMDPERFARQSMNYEGAVCCSMPGGYGLLVDGVPWNGDNNQDYPGEKDTLHIYYDDLHFTLSFPESLIDILSGKKKVEFYYFDDCKGYMERGAGREVRLGNQHSEMVVDMVDFGKALLKEGRNFQVFSERLLEIFIRREATETNNHLCRILNRRIQYVGGWKVGKLMDRLERALNNLKLRENGEIIWSDFKSAMGGHEPEVSVGKGPHTSYEYYDLVWKELPEDALLRIQDYLQAYQEKGFRWNHSLIKSAKKHWPFRWSLHENPPRMTLKTKVVKPPQPEVMTAMGLFLCLPWDWEKAGKPRPLEQIYIEDIDAKEWLKQLEDKEGPLLGNFVIQFHQDMMNGKWVQLKEEDAWYRQVEMTTLAEAMQYPRAVFALLNGAQSAIWGPHKLSWDERPEHFLFEMKGWKARAVPDDMVYGLLHTELKWILKKGMELFELAKDEPDILEKLSVLSLDELPGMIEKLKAAREQSLKKYKKK